MRTLNNTEWGGGRGPATPCNAQKPVPCDDTVIQVVNVNVMTSSEFHITDQSWSINLAFFRKLLFGYQ